MVWDMDKHTEGLLSIHSAVFIFGLTALFAKLISLSAFEITLLRTYFAVIAIALYIRYHKQSLRLRSWRDYRIAFILGGLLGGHWITYFHAMQVSSVATGIIALYTYPVITVFLEPFFHAGKPQLRDVLSAVWVLLGVFLLVPEFSFNNQVTQGVLWGILSAFLFAMRNILHGRYFNHYPARHTLLYQGIFIMLLLTPFSGQLLLQVTLLQWGQLILLGVFFTALPHTLFANSLRYLKAKSVSLIACMQVVYGTVFAALFLGEQPGVLTLVGGMMVISAAVFETLSKRAERN